MDCEALPKHHASRGERKPIMTDRFDESAVWTPEYARWRHGGWYVTNVRYPSGAVGCVSNNYADKKWRIACNDSFVPFPSRDAAARAERVLALSLAERSGSTTKLAEAVRTMRDPDADTTEVLHFAAWVSGWLAAGGHPGDKSSFELSEEADAIASAMYDRLDGQEINPRGDRDVVSPGVRS